MLILFSLNFCFISIFLFVMIFSSNAIYSILSLILITLGLVFVLFFLNVEFLSYILLIVYIGAVIILFLFCLMMIRTNVFFESFFFNWKHFFFFLICLKLFNLFISSFYQTYLIDLTSQVYYSSVWLSNFINYKTYDIFIFTDLLYTNAWYSVILISLILLVGMVGSIALCLSRGFFSPPLRTLKEALFNRYLEFQHFVCTSKRVPTKYLSIMTLSYLITGELHLLRLYGYGTLFVLGVVTLSYYYEPFKVRYTQFLKVNASPAIFEELCGNPLSKLFTDPKSIQALGKLGIGKFVWTAGGLLVVDHVVTKSHVGEIYTNELNKWSMDRYGKPIALEDKKSFLDRIVDKF